MVTIMKDIAKDLLISLKQSVKVILQIVKLVQKCMPPFQIVSDVSRDIGMLIMKLDFKLRQLPFKLAKSLRQVLLVPRDMVRFAGSLKTLINVVRASLSSRATALTAPNLKRLDSNDADASDTELLPSADDESASLLGSEFSTTRSDANSTANGVDEMPAKPPPGTVISIQDDEGEAVVSESDEESSEEDDNAEELESIVGESAVDRMSRVTQARASRASRASQANRTSSTAAPMPQAMARVSAAMPGTPGSMQLQVQVETPLPPVSPPWVQGQAASNSLALNTTIRTMTTAEKLRLHNERVAAMQGGTITKRPEAKLDKLATTPSNDQDKVGIVAQELGLPPTGKMYEDPCVAPEVAIQPSINGEPTTMEENAPDMNQQKPWMAPAPPLPPGAKEDVPAVNEEEGSWTSRLSLHAFSRAVSLRVSSLQFSSQAPEAARDDAENDIAHGKALPGESKTDTFVQMGVNESAHSMALAEEGMSSSIEERESTIFLSLVGCTEAAKPTGIACEDQESDTPLSPAKIVSKPITHLPKHASALEEALCRQSVAAQLLGDGDRSPHQTKSDSLDA